MNRRRALLAGVAAVAAAGGAGVGWWQMRRDAGVPPPADPALWTMQFEQPDGGQLALGALRGRPLLLNFWATWCAPCVRELPLLDRFHREQPAGGWRVAGLAVDTLAPVQEFLAQHKVTFPIGLAGAVGIDLARRLGNTSGALPFTAVFDSRGSPIEHKLGVVDPGDLQRWVAAMR
jgi:thiol-disulfide isomerase/thioredoxin